MSITRAHTLASAAVLSLLVYAGCDFQAAEDAFDDFNIIIELEPINTVMGAVIVDHATGNFLESRLTFSGPGASVLIDAYSDPLTNLDAGQGIATFGINNSVVPSDASPFELTVTAQADGYFKKTRQLQVTRTGLSGFSIRLASSDFTTPVPGTAAVEDRRANTSSSGFVSQTVTIATPPVLGATSAASITMPQGALLLDDNGLPLVGQLTTSIRSYDAGQGVQAMPQAAYTNAEGNVTAPLFAAIIEVTDPSGRVAATSQGASPTEFRFESDDPGLGLFVGQGVTVSSYDFGTGVRTALLDTFVVAGASKTGFTTAAVVGGVVVAGAVVVEDNGSSSCPIAAPKFGLSATVGALDHIVTLVHSGGEQAITTTLTGDGRSSTTDITYTTTLAAGDHSLRTLLGTGSARYDRRTGVWSVLDDCGTTTSGGTYSYTVMVQYQGDDGSLTSTVIGSPFSGSSTITLPDPDLFTYNVTAGVECPAGQQFDPVIAEVPDGLVVTYKVDGSTDAATILTSPTPDISESRISVSGDLSLVPNTAYWFGATLGDETTSTVQTTPASGGAWSIELSPAEVNLTCETS